jgi:hypothetical protein
MVGRQDARCQSVGRRAIQMLWVAAAVVLGCAPGFAQSGAGSIHGTVQDPSGAVIVGATVHVVNQGTNVAVDSTTNKAGYYTVPSLFTGSYTVTFSAPRMAAFETSITLQAGQDALIDTTLKPGGVQEKVVVQGNTIQLATYDSPTVSTTLDNQRINQLPMNGRSLLTLDQLVTPGLEGGGERANGNMQAALEYVQDGSPLTNRNLGGVSTVMPDPDAIQELHLEMDNSSAKFATPGTAVLTTKSGTNHIHGSLFETTRNNAVGIAKARQNPSNYKAPHLVRNEFGGSVGGPIVLPWLYNGRNKSFFFVTFERLSLAQTVSGQFTVPTQAMMNGDFSSLTDGSGIFHQLYDPATTAPSTNCNGNGPNQYCRAPFQNNQIPTSRLSPLAKLLYQITPAPNNTNNPMVQYNYTGPEPNNTTQPNLTMRFDHTINEDNRAYARYTQGTSSQLYWNATNPGAPTIAGAGMPANMANMALADYKVYSGAIGYTHVFSPTFFAETVLSGQWEHNSTGGNDSPTTDYRKQWGLPENFGPSSFAVTGSGNESTNSGLFETYQMNGDSYEGSQRLFDVDENLSKTLGRHQLDFGIRYRYEHLGVLPDQTVSYTEFGGLGTALLDPAVANEGSTPNTGNANADFFLGDAAYYEDALTGRHFAYHDMEFDSYAQDDWHVTPKLTVNLGLRWEVHPAPAEENGQNNGFDFANDAIVTPVSTATLISRGATTQGFINNLENLGAKFETAPVAGIPSSMIYNSDFVFGPRLGVAFAPYGSRGAVFRGGFGRYVYPIPLRNFYATQASNTPYGYTYIQSFTTPSQSSAQYTDGLPNEILRYPQAVVAGQNSAGVINTSGTTGVAPGAVNMMFMTPHYPPNIVSQANVTLEQPLKWDSVLRISWVYDHGSNLDQYAYFDTAPSTYVWIAQNGTAFPSSSYLAGTYNRTFWNPSQFIEDQRGGWSTDNALQANFEHQYKNGWAFQMFYVYSMAFRVGGNTFRDSTIDPIGDYLPNTFPGQASLASWATPKWLDRFENYERDTAIPQHRVRANGIYDLPFGRNKRLLGHVNRFLDEIVGGYQLAGDMNLNSQYFSVTSSNWGGANSYNEGSISKVHLYGKKQYPVTDCTSGTCLKGYQLFNGFINPLQLSDPCGASPYSGIQTKDQPYETPINMTPGTVTCNGTAIQASNSNYLNNNVPVTLSNGTTVQTGYSPGPAMNPFAKAQYRGPFNWTADTSLFKVFPIREEMNLRVNLDAFNVFNIQGYNNPSSTTGIQYFTSSYNTPRQLQISARLTF